MTGSFAYSFDRESFTGTYATREAALAAAGRALRDRADQPEGIFVGQWTVPDAQTAGHADDVLEAMKDRFRRATGETGFLDHVTEQDAAELDSMLQRTLSDWLTRHGSAPKATRVHAVSHHPVPNVLHVAVPAGERETSLIGEA